MSRYWIVANDDRLHSRDFIIQAFLFVYECVECVVVLACLSEIACDEAEKLNKASLVLDQLRTSGNIVDHALLSGNFLFKGGC